MGGGSWLSGEAVCGGVAGCLGWHSPLSHKGVAALPPNLLVALASVPASSKLCGCILHYTMCFLNVCDRIPYHKIHYFRVYNSVDF